MSITVEIVYAKPNTQRILSIDVPEDCTIEAAIQASGILQLFPEIDLRKHKVGIFSQPRQLSDPLQAGDRIEIYRPLLIDPKEARRAKAKKKKG